MSPIHGNVKTTKGEQIWNKTETLKQTAWNNQNLATIKEQLTPNLKLVTFCLHRSLDREENDCDSTLYFLLILLTPTKEFSSLLSTLRSHSKSSRIPRISTSLSFNFFLFFFFWGDSSLGSSDIFGTTFYINESQSYCIKQTH